MGEKQPKFGPYISGIIRHIKDILTCKHLLNHSYLFEVDRKPIKSLKHQVAFFKFAKTTVMGEKKNTTKLTVGEM